MIGHFVNHLFTLEEALEARDQGEVCKLVLRLSIWFELKFVAEGAGLKMLISLGICNAGIGTAVVNSGFDSG